MSSNKEKRLAEKELARRQKAEADNRARDLKAADEARRTGFSVAAGASMDSGGSAMNVNTLPSSSRAEDVVLAMVEGEQTMDQMIIARSRAVESDRGTAEIEVRLKRKVNGKLAHELSVGDAIFVKEMYRLVMPFNPTVQLIYCIAMGASFENAKLLVVARLGLFNFWKRFLRNADADELANADVVAHHVAQAEVENDQATTVNAANVDINGKTYSFPTVTYTQAMKDWDPSATNDEILIPGNAKREDLTVETLFLIMKDVAMLVSANLVKSGHHYITEQNGPFRAIERKLLHEDSLPDVVRGIVYHDAIHPFTRLSKLNIYASWKNTVNRNVSPWNELDPVVVKRLPVVPAGAAWLSVGVAILYEILSIPAFDEEIPDDYKTTLAVAAQTLNQIKTSGIVDQSVLMRFEAMAAFAYGILLVVAPNHSALRAPSFKKMYEQKIGAATAGSQIARNIQQNM